jgi:hypothetical protein
MNLPARHGGARFLIPALRRVRPEDWAFEANLSYTVRPSFSKKKKKKEM